MSSDASDMPPFTSERKDSEIEALRFCFCELARALHESGTLDMLKLKDELANAEWVFGTKPQTLASVQWYVEALEYMRLKLGPFNAKALR